MKSKDQCYLEHYVWTCRSLLTFKRNIFIEPSKILGKTWDQYFLKNTLKSVDNPRPYSTHPTNVQLFQSICYSLLFLNFKEDGGGI